MPRIEAPRVMPRIQGIIWKKNTGQHIAALKSRRAPYYSLDDSDIHPIINAGMRIHSPSRRLRVLHPAFHPVLPGRWGDF